MESNPLKIEQHFSDRITALRNACKSPEELSTALGNLLANIDVQISLAIIDRDEAAQAAWESARSFVHKEIG